MVRFIIALIILVISGTAGYFINNFPATVTLHYYDANQIPVMLDMSLILWAILSIIAAFIVLLIFKLLLFIWRSPKIFSRNMKDRKHRKANKLLRKGLAELISGHYLQAEKHLAKGAKLSDELEQNSVIFYENAAIAATYQRAHARRDKYLLKARQKSDNKQQYMTFLSEAELYIANKNYTKALPLLEKVHAQEPKNLKVVVLLDQVYHAQKDWQKAWKILPQIKTQIGLAAYDERKSIYAKGLLNDTPDIETYEQLAGAWKRLPKDVRQDPEMIIEFANSLVENGHGEEAERLLSSEIKKRDNGALVQVYSQLHGVDHQRQLKLMKTLLPRYTNDPLFFYAFATIAFKAKDYELAAEQIEAALKLQQTPESFALWGQILEALNQPQAALVAYRQGVQRIEVDEPLQGDLLPKGEQVIEPDSKLSKL